MKLKGVKIEAGKIEHKDLETTTFYVLAGAEIIHEMR